jgi:uncharacterized membrane protein YeaQ/YmgE (transglycosylase-associated protein family)
VSVLAWILFGFLAGAAARLVTPGKHPHGCITTIAIGITGAVLGGLGGSVLFNHRVEWHFGLGPFALAVLGAVILLLFLQAVRRRD